MDALIISQQEGGADQGGMDKYLHLHITTDDRIAEINSQIVTKDTWENGPKPTVAEMTGIIKDLLAQPETKTHPG